MGHPTWRIWDRAELPNVPHFAANSGRWRKMARHDIPFDAPSATNGSMYLIDPREIQIREEYNGRHEEPSVDDLIEDFLNPSMGQLEPVLLTKDDDRAPVLIAGHRRYRAAIEVTSRKKGPFDGVFKLKCVYFRGSPIECFMMTVRENLNRKEISPTCDGWNILKFRNFGMSDADIAIKVYGRKTVDGKPDVRWIEDRAAMADLTPEAAEAVSSGRVKPSAVVALAKMKKQAQRDLVKDNAAKITTAVIKRAEAPAPPLSTGTAPPKPPAPRKWTEQAFRNLVDKFMMDELPPRLCGKPCDVAIRTVLREILECLDEEPPVSE